MGRFALVPLLLAFGMLNAVCAPSDLRTGAAPVAANVPAVRAPTVYTPDRLPLPPGLPRLSPEGRLVAVGTGTGVGVYELDGHKRGEYIGPFGGFRWLDDSSGVLITGTAENDMGGTSVLLTSTGSVNSLSFGTEPLTTATMTSSPDGLLLAAAVPSAQGQVIVYLAERTGRRQRELGGGVAVAFLGWSGDGLVRLQSDRAILSYDTAGRLRTEQVLPAELRGSRLMSAAISPDRSATIFQVAAPAPGTSSSRFDLWALGPGGVSRISQGAIPGAWIGPHEVVVREASTLSTYNLASGAIQTLPVRIDAAGKILALSGPWVLESTAGTLTVARVTDGLTGTIDFAADGSERFVGLPNGVIGVETDRAVYLIRLP
jgi:hypothetical protein